MASKRVSYMEDSITMVIERSRLVLDSFEQFRTIDGMDMHKEIKIHYVGEQAQDAGGVFRDWITDLCRSLFGASNTDMEDGSCGLEGHLFKQVRCREDLTYFPNPRSKSMQSLQFYKFAGLVLGKAMFDKIPVNIKLHRVLLKRLVGRSQSLKIADLRDFDEQIYKSLIYLANDQTVDVDLLEMNFTLEGERGETIELV